MTYRQFALFIAGNDVVLTLSYFCLFVALTAQKKNQIKDFNRTLSISCHRLADPYFFG